jgi:hypothetical protein
MGTQRWNDKNYFVLAETFPNGSKQGLSQLASSFWLVGVKELFLCAIGFIGFVDVFNLINATMSNRYFNCPSKHAVTLRPAFVVSHESGGARMLFVHVN